jgi:TolB-like protein/predicted Ser/Thr protein kinase
LIGQTLSHYRITAAIGAGGMGEVYRAKDTKLGRDVALKVLPAEMASSPERLERFQREAKALAVLDHPGIVTVYSVEEAGGVHFLTMQLVEGKSLDKLVAEGALPVERIVAIGAAVADALTAAHEKGIVHRDLKPANVVVTEDGGVKVLDFGLAKMRPLGESVGSELPTEAQTRDGVVMGTVPYMSPEQVSGRPVDHRTDVFSLGVVLYEMASGRRPFQGQSTAELASAILRDAPPAVAELRPELPADLVRIVRRCLEKDKRQRFQTARDVGNELRDMGRHPTPASGSPAQPGSALPDTSGAARLDEGFWVAVLPFKHRGSDPGLEALAEGLTEEIVTGLSRFSYLRVVTRSSSSQYAGEAIGVRAVGRALGAAYVLEGSLRQAGSVLRVAVQLVDASTGAHLWSESFDRDLSGLNAFQAQDQIADRVVSTVADPYGVLARSMATTTRSKMPEDLTPYEAVLRFFLYQQRVSAEDHRVTRAALEHAVELASGSADAWAGLAVILLDEYRHGFDPRPGSLDRALEAANRAVDADPTNQLAYSSLAQIHFYRRETGAFRATAERAFALNRRDGNTLADLGLRFGDSGDWPRCLELTRAAMALNPHHPGWYRFGEFLDHYRRGEYAEALSVAEKINMPGYYADPLALAASHAQLGNAATARAALKDLLQLQPDFVSKGAEILDKRLYSQPELVARLMDGLRKAGLDLPSKDAAGASAPAVQPGTASRSGPSSAPLVGGDHAGVAIAVLPFSDMSPAQDQQYLCEGMAEEVMNALVRIDGIRVASRTSAFRVSREEKDLAAIGHALSVEHVLEGSVRTSGRRLRVTAQLSEVATGYQLWSERFDREVEDIFSVQDEIATGVVEAVKARLAPGARSVRARAQARNFEAYRSYLLGQHLRYAKEDHGGAARAFQEAVRLDPTHAPSWTGLAESLTLMAHMSLIPADEACARAREALATAMELQGESADGLHGEAFVAFIERRWKDMEASSRRAVELQPTHVPSLGVLGMVLSLHQKPDEAAPFFERGREADPLASFPYMLTALGLLTVRRHQDAHRYAEQALVFEKDDASALFCAALANVALGHFEQGIAEAEHGVAVAHRGGDFVGLLGWALATAGRKDEARTLLAELRTRPTEAPQIVSEGWLLGALGEVDAAFEVFARAAEQNQLWLYYSGVPGFDPLRADPRFPALLARLGLPSEGGP